MTTLWNVEYQVGPYSGTITVTADENSESAHVITLAKQKLYRSGHPGIFYEDFRITGVERCIR